MFRPIYIEKLVQNYLQPIDLGEDKIYKLQQ